MGGGGSIIPLVLTLLSKVKCKHATGKTPHGQQSAEMIRTDVSTSSLHAPVEIYGTPAFLQSYLKLHTRELLWAAVHEPTSGSLLRTSTIVVLCIQGSQV